METCANKRELPFICILLNFSNYLCKNTLNIITTWCCGRHCLLLMQWLTWLQQCLTALTEHRQRPEREKLKPESKCMLTFRIFQLFPLHQNRQSKTTAVCWDVDKQRSTTWKHLDLIRLCKIIHLLILELLNTQEAEGARHAAGRTKPNVSVMSKLVCLNASAWLKGRYYRYSLTDNDTGFQLHCLWTPQALHRETVFFINAGWRMTSSFKNVWHKYALPFFQLRKKNITHKTYSNQYI